jgi:hypothetical protein
MCEHGHISLRGPDSGDNPVDPRANLSGTLSVWAAVAEDQPIGLRRPDLLRGKALVVAVVPLLEISLNLCLRSKSCKLAGLPRPLQRAAQDQAKRSRGRVGLPESRDLAACELAHKHRHGIETQTLAMARDLQRAAGGTIVSCGRRHLPSNPHSVGSF